ncbi:putative B6 ABC transporter substrate-binding protein [Pseudooceanicola nanhaiensis]|uniref:putative B6 ABC transporter substrate-binding protein n=1 Tax=Pseudooceanicola nanhaiensis TaxID=375761 RepID=UPI001CD441F3|nr:BMP family protein [Pseudooceanicola nanhaiensis]MCA0921278.1 BMP family protein [Pseudooceanicola nanhaiensis]
MIFNRSVRPLAGAVLGLALSTGAMAAEVKTIAVLTPEQGTDFGWNQQGIEGAEAAAEATGKEIIVAQGLGYGNVRPTLRELAEDGADLIIAHASGYTTEAIEVAKEMNVHVAVGATSEPPLVGMYELAGEKGSFLAGVLAARMTKTGTIGIVVSSESPNWNAQSAGFAQGVKSVAPETTLRYAIIGPAAYADVAGARRVTESVIASGADVIFGQGNGSSFGMIQAVETLKTPGGDKVWFIDVIGDKSSIDKGHLLSSVLWDMGPVFTQMVKDIEADTFGTASYALNLEDGSQRLLKTDHIPEDVWAELEDVKAKIISGEIEVEMVIEPAATRAMMSETIASAE